ncbi:MAG: hypothetical protein IJ303_03900 [Clostridia bacterium]|nr:hypothetical protein [Clostridia bacterium]
MSKFFRICGVIFFLGAVCGFCLIFSAAASDSLLSIFAGSAIGFGSVSAGLLFIYTAELLERIAALEKKIEKLSGPS